MTAPVRNSWLDLTRTAGAGAVVLFHFNVLDQPHPPGPASESWHRFWAQGHFGVPVFFALSGYCLLPGWQRSRSAGPWLARRARRLLPSFWASLLLVLAVAAGVRLATGTNDVAVLPRTALDWLATFLLCADPVTTIPALNWVYWTLSALLAFSVLASLPLLAAAPRRLILLAGLHLGLCVWDLGLRPPGVGPWFFVRDWPSFGAGLAAAVWLADRRVGGVMLAVSVGHAVASWLGGHERGAYSVVGLVAASLFLASAGRTAPSPVRALARLGEASYSLYLIHVPVGIYLFHRLLPAHPATDLAYVAAQLLLLAATAAAAWGFHRWVETPLTGPRAP